MSQQLYCSALKSGRRESAGNRDAKPSVGSVRSRSYSRCTGCSRPGGIMPLCDGSPPNQWIYPDLPGASRQTDSSKKLPIVNETLAPQYYDQPTIDVSNVYSQ